MNKTIKIGACDFWPGFQLRHSIFYDVIVQCGYSPVIDNNDPDILFYSVFSNNHVRYTRPIKIWFSGENWSLPNFNQCHFALSGYYINDSRHYRLPLYVKYARNYISAKLFFLSYDQFSKPRDLSKIKPKTKFCNFLYSNCDPNREGTKFRQEFFHRLSQYKHVDAAGGCLNNMGGKYYGSKIPFLQDYKFTIAMENSNSCQGIYGYTTEKIFEPMIADSIPIYWGNPTIGTDFNTKAIVNYHDYNNVDKMVEKIIEIDNNDTIYNQYLSEMFVPNYDTSPLNMNNIINFLKSNVLK